MFIPNTITHTTPEGIEMNITLENLKTYRKDQYINLIKEMTELLNEIEQFNNIYKQQQQGKEDNEAKQQSNEDFFTKKK